MSKSYDLSIKQKLVIIPIVIILCIGIFELRVLDYIAVPCEHLTIMRGDNYKKNKSDDEKIHNFYEDRIAIILISSEQSGSGGSKKVQINADCLAIQDGEAEDEWRDKYPAIIKKLTEIGARVIVFDIGFGRDMGESDNNLEDAIKQARKRGTSVIIPFAYLKKEDATPYIADKIKKAVGDKGYGLACGKSRFGVTIKTPLAVEIAKPSDKYYYSLSLRAVEAYWGGEIIDIKDFESCQIEIQSNNNICQKRICRFFDSTKIDIPYRKNDKDEWVTKVLPMANLFVDTSEIPKNIIFEYDKIKNIFESDNILDRESFNSKIVIIGKTDDIHNVTIADKRYGVLFQADAINTIFRSTEDNKSIQPLLKWFEYIFIIIFGLYGIILNSYISWWMLNMSRLKLIALTSLTVLITLIACFEFSFRLYIEKRILINWIYYFITFLLILSAGWIKRFVLKRSIHEQNL